MTRLLLLSAWLGMLWAAISLAETTLNAKHSWGLARAPQTAHLRTNPYAASAGAVQAGRKLFLRHCAECHGEEGEGSRKGSVLESRRIARAADGVLFWFLTNGNLAAGMPAWSRLPDGQRWQLVAFLKTLGSAAPKDASAPRAFSPER